LGQGDGRRDPDKPFLSAIEVNLFVYRDRVVRFDTEHGSLQLGVAEELHDAQRAFLAIDQGG